MSVCCVIVYVKNVGTHAVYLEHAPSTHCAYVVSFSYQYTMLTCVGFVYLYGLYLACDDRRRMFEHVVARLLCLVDA